MAESEEYLQRAARQVRRLGFKLAEEPRSEIPELPSDVTAVTDQVLMNLFQQIVSWIDYTEVQVTSLQIEEKQEDQTLEELMAQEQIKHRSEKTVSIVKALALDNPTVVAQRERLLMLFARKSLLETVYNSLERKRFLVSREISRRQNRE